MIFYYQYEAAYMYFQTHLGYFHKPTKTFFRLGETQLPNNVEFTNILSLNIETYIICENYFFIKNLQTYSIKDVWYANQHDDQFCLLVSNGLLFTNIYGTLTCINI